MRFLIYCFLILNICSWTIADPNLNYNDIILQDDFSDVVKSALDFLKRRQKRDGSFIYDFQPFKGRVLATDNIVRQAGTFFALATTWDGQNSGQKATIDQAVNYFKKNSFPFTVNNIKLRIISKNHEGFTGAICLFLAGYFSLHRHFPKEYPIDSPIYKELLETIDYYFHPLDGVPDYINLQETYLEKLGRTAEVYATAQYFLVLSIYQLTFRQRNFHPSLVECLGLYLHKISDHELMLTYHWLMLALSLLYETEDPDWTPTIKTLIETLQAKHEKEYPMVEEMQNYCAKAEGYAYYLRHKQSVHELNRQHLYKLGKHLRYLKNFQITEETYLTEVKNGQTNYLPIRQTENAIGGFWHKEKDVHHLRIDYTQHCLSAYQGYLNIMDSVYPDIKAYEEAKLKAYEEKLDKKTVAQPKRMQKIILKTVTK